MAFSLYDLLLLIAPAAAEALSPEEQETLGYEQDPAYQQRANVWAKEMGEQYPEQYGFPQGQADLAGQRLTEMLGGELSPAVQKYLGYKYGQAWEKALPYYADIGAGPGTLASGQIKLGERQAIEGAYLGQQQIATGMQYMPSYTEMMLSPYMLDVAKWKNVSDLIGKNFPGAPEVSEYGLGKDEWGRNLLKPGTAYAINPVTKPGPRKASAFTY